MCVNAATHRARHYDLTPLITDVANGKPASVLHMLSSHVCIAVDANSSYLSNHAQSMRRRERDADSLHRVSRQVVQAQVVAALVIRDAVGDAINRPQAAVKPGPWPGRRAARRSALAGALVVPPQRTEPSAGYVHGRTFTWPHVVSVYLYIRRSETGLPLPEAPQASPTSTCAPALRADYYGHQ